VRHTLVLCGDYPAPQGWQVVPQRGDGFGDRLANAYADTALPGAATVLIGMDAPQVTIALLAEVAGGLSGADAVLAPATDGGWWALALRDPLHAAVLRAVPMSTSDTGALTMQALRRFGLSVATASTLRDVDTADDARAVADAQPHGRFAAAVRQHLPVTAPAGGAADLRLIDPSGARETWTEAARWFARIARG
jgi:CTP:molybdopterin cytidylyltransferase MocA